MSHNQDASNVSKYGFSLTTHLSMLFNMQSPRAPSSKRTCIKIHQLTPRHKTAMVQHLLALSPEDRYLRFGYAASDEHITAHVETLNFQHATLFGIFNRSLKLVALAQTGFTLDRQCNRCAEFGVSVLQSYRGRSFGRALFQRSAMHARNEGVDRFLVHALTQNRTMLGIAKAAGASIVTEGDESQAMIMLPPADLDSQLSEVWQDNLARLRYNFNKWFKRVGALIPNKQG